MGPQTANYFCYETRVSLRNPGILSWMMIQVNVNNRIWALSDDLYMFSKSFWCWNAQGHFEVRITLWWTMHMQTDHSDHRLPTMDGVVCICLRGNFWLSLTSIQDHGQLERNVFQILFATYSSGIKKFGFLLIIYYSWWHVTYLKSFSCFFLKGGLKDLLPCTTQGSIYNKKMVEDECSLYILHVYRLRCQVSGLYLLNNLWMWKNEV